MAQRNAANQIRFAMKLRIWFPEERLVIFHEVKPIKS
jgi:hypothetical protein